MIKMFFPYEDSSKFYLGTILACGFYTFIFSYLKLILNKVPFIITDNKVKLSEGDLTNIAPTLLSYMDIKIPDEMKDSNTLFCE